MASNGNASKSEIDKDGVTRTRLGTDEESLSDAEVLEARRTWAAVNRGEEEKVGSS